MVFCSPLLRPMGASLRRVGVSRSYGHCSQPAASHRCYHALFESSDRCFQNHVPLVIFTYNNGTQGTTHISSIYTHVYMPESCAGYIMCAWKRAAAKMLHLKKQMQDTQIFCFGLMKCATFMIFYTTCKKHKPHTIIKFEISLKKIHAKSEVLKNNCW